MFSMSDWLIPEPLSRISMNLPCCGSDPKTTSARSANASYEFLTSSVIATKSLVTRSEPSAAKLEVQLKWHPRNFVSFWHLQLRLDERPRGELRPHPKLIYGQKHASRISSPI